MPRKMKQFLRQSYPTKFGYFDEQTYKDDVHRIYLIKRMIRRFLKTNEINYKLILNYTIITYNIYDNKIIYIFENVLDKEELEIMYSFMKILNIYDTDKDCKIITELLTDFLDRQYKYSI